jgi:hypothetical protein
MNMLHTVTYVLRKNCDADSLFPKVSSFEMPVLFILSAVDHCPTEILMTFRGRYLGKTLKILHDL